MPENESHDLVIDTLYQSWKIYNNSRFKKKSFFFCSLFILFYISAIILFVITEREFNIGDQMLIEQGLLSYEDSSLLVKHVTFIDICRYCFLDSKGILYL